MALIWVMMLASSGMRLILVFGRENINFVLLKEMCGLPRALSMKSRMCQSCLAIFLTNSGMLQSLHKQPKPFCDGNNLVWWLCSP